jgi:uroporphyrinogen-III synthase
MKRLLVLRPEPGASATARRAHARGLETRCVPLFEVEPLEWTAPAAANFDGVLLTSVNAVRHGGEKLNNYRGLEAFAVGEATADAARDAGFVVAATGSADVERLLASIDPGLKLLHLGGEDRREPTEATQSITTVPVYRARALPAPDLGDIREAVALIHSPRAGRRFAELVDDRSAVAIVAISDAAAEAAGVGWAAVEAAQEPTDEALLALAARLCNKPDL